MDLNVQTWLKENNGDFELLNKELGINTTFHPDDERCILNYDMIESPKNNPMVSECRGIVLNRNTYEVIARAFNRFFNLGEVKGECDKFCWEESIGTDKEDGSLILLYWYNDAWHINTRGSFGGFGVNGASFTWRDLFFSALHDPYIVDKLGKDCTYVFELCTPYTQIVRIYPEPTVYLLSVFNTKGGYEFTHDCVDDVANIFGFNRPKSYKFGDQFDTVAHIAKIAQTDKTYEGIVLRDKNNRRIKVKSDLYVQLHRLSNNRNITAPYRIAEIIMSGEQDEVLTYFPYLALDFEKISGRIDQLVKEMDNLWFCYWDVVSQRKFADAVKHHKLAKILFDARKIKSTPTELLKHDEYKKMIVDIIAKEMKV